MVSLRTYQPNNLGVSPFGIAQELAKPYDYDGALKEMMNWQNLTNQEATTEINQATAETKQNEIDLEAKRKAELEKRLSEGQDPSKIDMADVEKTIGNIGGYLKVSDAQKKESAQKQNDQLKVIKDLTTIGKSNPSYATSLAEKLGLSGYQAPEQKSKAGKEKVKKPEVVLDPKTGMATIANLGDNDLIPLALHEKMKKFNTENAPPEPTPPPGPGILETVGKWMNGDAPAATPGPVPGSPTPPSPAPAGMKWQVSSSGKFRLVPR